MLDLRKKRTSKWKHRYNLACVSIFFTEIHFCVCSAAELPNVYVFFKEVTSCLKEGA